MVDVHTHILPGVDDGVRTEDEAVELARVEAAGGTLVLFATPHVMEARDVGAMGERADKLASLRERLASEGVEIELLGGAEVYPFRGALDALASGTDLTLGSKGRHVLVDLPLSQFPHDLGAFLFELQALGYSPILAHPERTAPVQRDPDVLKPLLERSIALQVNAGSVLGQYGPGAVRAAETILSRRWASCMASDSHRPSTEPKLRRAADAVAARHGGEYAGFLVETGPAAVARGEAIPQPPAPQAPVRRGFWPFRH